MDTLTLTAIIFLGFFLFFLFSGWLIAFCLGAVSILAFILIAGRTAGNFAFLGYNALTNYNLLALPFFILMGEILIQGGVATRLYGAVSPLMERIHGGLIYTNILMNTVLGAACGSTVAATSATSAVAIPELNKRGYDKGLCYGSLASAGCLAGLIPPSVGLIIYSAITDTSLGELFIAGIIPGLILATSLILVSSFMLRIRPQLAPSIKKEEVVPVGRALLIMLRNLWPLAILIIIVLGTIYTGLATPTESATYGVVGALLLGARRLNLGKIKTSLLATLRISVSLLFIIGIASIYGFALNSLGMRGWVVDALLALPGGVYVQIYIIWLVVMLLGMFLDSGSSIIITTPILLPFVVSLGFDPIWFGIWIILAVELGNITPPVGLTLYAVIAVSGDKLETVARGCLPYWASFLIAITPITLFPAIVLWLPRVAGFGP